jgi:hypothetical protein
VGLLGKEAQLSHVLQLEVQVDKAEGTDAHPLLAEQKPDLRTVSAVRS